MSDIIEIPKINETWDNYPAWVPTVDVAGKTIRPHIVCNCGANTNIQNHVIHKDGRITASYYHTQQGGCGWHVFLKMKDWNGLEFRSGADYPDEQLPITEVK